MVTFLDFYYERWHVYVEIATALHVKRRFLLPLRADCLLPDDGRVQVVLMLSAFYEEQSKKEYE